MAKELGREPGQFTQDQFRRFHERNRLGSPCDANALVRMQNEHGWAPVNARHEKSIQPVGFSGGESLCGDVHTIVYD